mgnify:CR=1 FL=1
MIMFAGYAWIDYQEVKRAWKNKGLRGLVTGRPCIGCDVYAVGEGFYMHPLGTTVWDTEDLDRRETNHTISIGQSSLYGNSYCGTLNSF